MRTVQGCVGGAERKAFQVEWHQDLSKGLGGTEPLPLPQELSKQKYKATSLSLSLKPVRGQSKVPPAMYGAHINLHALGEKVLPAVGNNTC